MKRIIASLFKGLFFCLIVTSCEKIIQIQENQNISLLSKLRVVSSNDIILDSLDVEIYYSYENYSDFTPDTILFSTTENTELYISDIGDYIWFRVWYNNELSERVCINPMQKYVVPKSFENISSVTYEIEVDDPIIILEYVHYSYCYHSDGNEFLLIIKDDNLISKFDSVYYFPACFTKWYEKVNYEILDIQDTVNIEFIAVETQNKILSQQIIPIENIQANYIGTETFGFNIKTLWK